jgi:hypothetical protein
MSSGQMSFWANVSGQMSLGQCRMSKCRITVFSMAGRCIQHGWKLFSAWLKVVFNLSAICCGPKCWLLHDLVQPVGFNMAGLGSVQTELLKSSGDDDDDEE